MIKKINVMERNYEGALPYGKEEVDWKLRRKNERGTKVERNMQYLVPDCITITIDEMARAADNV